MIKHIPPNAPNKIRITRNDITKQYRDEDRIKQSLNDCLGNNNKKKTLQIKMGLSVLLSLFICSNEVCNTDCALLCKHPQNSIFKYDLGSNELKGNEI